MIDLVTPPDKEAMERLGRIAEEARKDMGEERYRELNDEWERCTLAALRKGRAS